MSTRRNAGFTLIELMIVVAIIAIIVAIAIPKFRSARISANENAALATLRAIASAQHQIESACAIDTDADGGGEFGYFGELAGMAPMRKYGALPVDAPVIGVAPGDLLDPPILPTSFGDIQADGTGGGIVTRQGFVFKMWLPAPTAGGVTPGIAEQPTGGAASPPVVDPDNSEIFWSCYAWPVDASRSGNRVFFINQEGELLQFSNRAGVYSNTVAGGGAQPSFDAAHSIANDMASVLAINGVASVDTNLWTVVQ